MREEGVSIITRYFPDLNPTQIGQLELAMCAYQAWNTKINVVSRKDIDHLATHHILHSLAIAKIHPFLPGQRVLDVGTGGGFPGVPLAILFPETTFLLVDSIQKKIRVVQEVCQMADLKNVRYEAVRAEELKETFDFVVSRAVTSIDRFLPWVENKIQWKTPHNGILYLKGGDLSDELMMIDPRVYKTQIHEISSVFDNPFFETKKLVHIFKEPAL